MISFGDLGGTWCVSKKSHYVGFHLATAVMTSWYVHVLAAQAETCPKKKMEPSWYNRRVISFTQNDHSQISFATPLFNMAIHRILHPAETFSNRHGCQMKSDLDQTYSLLATNAITSHALLCPSCGIHLHYHSHSQSASPLSVYPWRVRSSSQSLIALSCTAEPAISAAPKIRRAHRLRLAVNSQAAPDVTRFLVATMTAKKASPCLLASCCRR